MAELFAGRYLLVDVVGIGGAGAVWRTWDRKRGSYLAAKVLQQRDAGALIRFVREQSLRIDHPHVLAPNGWAAEDDQVLFTMDLMRGGSVADLIGDYGPLPVGVTGELLAQLADGLSAVHAAGIVHRDLKPANLLLEPTGRQRPHLRLSDFGIAVVLGEPRLTQQQFLIGTPGYFAPETLQGAAPDPRQDIYGLGIVGCQMLTGEPPPAEPLDAKAEPPPGLPRPVEGVLRRLLAEDPADRYPTAQQARAAVIEAFGGLDAVANSEMTEPLEVFDQLEPWPEGFDDTGPRAARAAPPYPAPGGPPWPPLSPSHRAGPMGARPPQTQLDLAGPNTPQPPYHSGRPSGPHQTPSWPSGRDQGWPSGPDQGRQSGANPSRMAGPTPARPLGMGESRPAGSPKRPTTLLWAAIAAGVIAVLLAGAAAWVTFGQGSGSPASVGGQQCTFANVGSTAPDDTGATHRCSQEPDGRYTWKREP